MFNSNRNPFQKSIGNLTFYLTFLIYLVMSHYCYSKDFALSVISSSQAIEMANKWTGFDTLYSNISDKSNSIKAGIDSNTINLSPLLHGITSERKSWKVTYENIALQKRGASNKNDNDNMKTYNVWIDSTTGLLLYAQIYSTSLSLSNSNIMQISEQDLTCDVQSLPVTSPDISMTDAISMTSINIGNERFVTIHFLVCANFGYKPEIGSEPTPTWIIASHSVSEKGRQDTSNEKPRGWIKTQNVNALTGKLGPLTVTSINNPEF